MSKFGISRLALLSSAAAFVLAACYNGTDNEVVAPSSKAISAPKVSADFGTASAGLIQVCVNPGMPSGPYSVAFTPVTNVVINTPEDNLNSYTKNDVEQTSPQTLINPGDCRLIFTKNHGTWIYGFGWEQSFTTMTITNTNPAQAGGTFSYVCFPGGGPSALCESGNPINPPVDGRTDISASATSGANPDHGSTVTFSYTLPVASVCTLGYPDASNMPKSGRSFNESEVLAAAQSVGGEVRAWYADEHAMLLGERQIVLKLPANQGGTMTFNHSFTSMGANNPASATGSPLINLGPTILSGDGAAIDPYGRPLFPAVFITDITSDATSRSGDWQQGGQPFRPNKLFGSWKAVVATVNYTKTPYVTTFATDADPAKNHLNLGAGSHAWPGSVSDQGYSTEIVWSAASLGLDPTHNYRLQFMVHDGDQNKTGGDVGQACMNIGPNIADRSVVF
jgi:hypothetical protein